jgi:nucleoside-specific outer membrane channel protein Tsx
MPRLLMHAFHLFAPVFALFCLALVGFSSTALAADWRNTELHVLHGDAYREPYNPNDVSKSIVTLQQVAGYQQGRYFFFVDVLQSNSHDVHATEVYGEAYGSLSLSKLTGIPLQNRWLRDINLTVGLNYGHKSYPDYRVNPRVILAGVTVDFNLPAFSYLNLDILAYADRGRFDGRDNGCHAETYQLTPVWKLPFSLGAAKFSFEGFADVIGKHGDCERQILAQPQLRWDVGHHFDTSDKLYLGVEYQYWHNKFGIEGLRESHPQVLMVWKF